MKNTLRLKNLRMQIIQCVQKRNPKIRYDCHHSKNTNRTVNKTYFCRGYSLNSDLAERFLCLQILMRKTGVAFSKAWVKTQTGPVYMKPRRA